MSFCEKKQPLYFSGQPVGGFWRALDNKSVFFFSQIIGVDNMLYVPINLRKNRRSRAVLLGQALDLASFFFNFIFFY
jgi:hypothetical protein